MVRSVLTYCYCCGIRRTRVSSNSIRNGLCALPKFRRRGAGRNVAHLSGHKGHHRWSVCGKIDLCFVRRAMEFGLPAPRRRSRRPSSGGSPLTRKKYYSLVSSSVAALRDSKTNTETHVSIAFLFTGTQVSFQRY